MTHTAWGNRETSYFYSLTPDKVLSAVETAGYRCTGRTMAMNSMENRVYDVEIDLDGEKAASKSDHFRIVKFYRPGRWTREQIQEEHDFLRDLRDNDIPVVAPEVLENGKTIGIVPEVEIFYSVFPKVGGRSPDEMDGQQLEIVGRLLARLHGVGRIREAKSRIPIDEVTYGVNNLKYLLDAQTIPLDLKSRYQKAAEEVVKLADPLLKRFPKQRLHGDCHLGNLLWGPQGPFWVDFDDMVVGPCIQDIWLVVPGRDAYGIEQREILLDAYSSMNTFDRASLALIEPLRALRFIHFSAWISRRWKDPAFPRAFPNFNSWDYWNEQTLDLEEQVRLIAGGHNFDLE
jgi:Ser/Thr protein kinase RdoA (MazF antagonist)